MAEKEDQQMNYLNNFLDKDGTNPSNNPPNKPPVEEQVMEEDYNILKELDDEDATSE